MQNAQSLPVSPEVRAYAEVQREREFEAVNAEAKQKWWRKLGAKTLDVLKRNPETVDVSAEIITADDIVDREVIEARAQQLITEFEPNAKVLRENEAEDNARTALFEALTASGHLSVVELPGELREVHEQVMQRLLNSYFRENIAPHEQERNFAEICEELTVQATFETIQRGDMPPGTKIVTVSDFAHPLGKEADKHGYRSANQKGMVRETTLEQRDGQLVRVIRQVSRSNTYAPGTIEKLRRANVPAVTRKGKMDLQLLSTQFLSVRHGAVEVVQLLDKLQRGRPVRFGEMIGPDTPSYENLEKISRLREHEVEAHIEELAQYEHDLDALFDEGKISLVEQRKRYVEAVREHVRAICVRFPAYTKDALGEDVVKDYQEAHRHYAIGDTAGAATVARGAAGREQAVVICGSATESPNQDPSNPEASKNQTLEEILERNWEGHTTCPMCNKRVYAVKKDGFIRGECGHWLEICTGNSGFNEPDGEARPQTAEDKNQIAETNAEKDFTAEFQAIIEATWGEGAEIDEQVGIGRAKYNIVQGGRVIAPDVKLGQLALARR